MAGFNLPPRQKMINLIYVVLLAMMAINVSSDVMKGFSVLTKNVDQQNESLKQVNQETWQKIHDKADKLTAARADSIYRQTMKLYATAESVKEKIIRAADKDDYRKGAFKKPEDMKSVPYVMLAPTQGNGRLLRKEVEALRQMLTGYIGDRKERDMVARFLVTDGGKAGYSWEKDCFSTLPAIGGIIFLNKIQENALISSTMTLRILTEKPLDAVSPAAKPDEGKQTPVRQLVAVMPQKMNILYVNIDNPLDLFTGAYEGKDLTLTCNNGRVSRIGDHWHVSPVRVGTLVLTVKDGTHVVGTQEFRVKEIPDPTAQISYTSGGRTLAYQGRTPISKDALIGMKGIDATYASDVLQVNFRVTGFQTIFVNADKSINALTSHGNKFTPQQIQKIKQMRSGEKFYISSIRVTGPDGREREIEPMDVIII